MGNVNNVGYELDWDAQIENDSPQYVTLPKGEYEFEVVGFERSRYTPTPNAKLPPCNMAVLTLKFEANEGTAVIKHKLFLHSSVEGLLCAFFTCIGQRKHGERFTMNWGAVLNATGRAQLGIREYKDKSGMERTINEVVRFLEPQTELIQQPIHPSPASPVSPVSYQPGRF